MLGARANPVNDNESGAGYTVVFLFSKVEARGECISAMLAMGFAAVDAINCLSPMPPRSRSPSCTSGDVHVAKAICPAIDEYLPEPFAFRHGLPIGSPNTFFLSGFALIPSTKPHNFRPGPEQIRHNRCCVSSQPSPETTMSARLRSGLIIHYVFCRSTDRQGSDRIPADLRRWIRFHSFR